MNRGLSKSSKGTVRTEVAEFQGLYGSFEFSERLLQKIWHAGYFLREKLKTTDGRIVEIIEAGAWNRVGGGPDFRDAVLRIGANEARGDIEMHFHARDWKSHGHSQNPSFDNVVLHVSLFAPDGDTPAARTSKGVKIPLLVLLPHLTCSIEEFALDDALESVTGASARSGLLEFMRGRPAEDVFVDLEGLARGRWNQKVGFARMRIDKLGWESACHQTALEILGYRHNRAPMLVVAERFPLRMWIEATPDSEALMAVGGGRWRVMGVRPANHPKVRLRQYDAWLKSVSDWPDRLESFPEWLPVISELHPIASVDSARRSGITRARERFASEIVGGTVSGTRLDTIITNGVLPLIVARTGADLFPAWCCWFAGDSPDWLKAALRDVPALGGKRVPLCEGLLQAALQLSLQQTASNSQLGNDRPGS